MEYLVIGGLAVAAVALAVFAGLQLQQHRTRRWLDDMTTRRLLVQTREGQTLDGVLTRVDADGIELSSLRVEGQQLSGAAWVARERIAWVQRPEEPRPATT